MTLELTRHTFTTADYDRMIAAGIFGEDDRLELIEGEIVEMSPISSRHAACAKRLNSLLGHSLGDAATIGIQDPVHIGERSEPQPDISVLRPSPNFYASAHPTADDIFLLIEVAESSVGIDRRVKVPLYGRHTVLEFWLVDVDDSLVTVYREPTPNGYASVRVARRGEALTMLAFPGKELAVDEILP
jgi:Uma2 family endonuclease